MDQSAPSLFKRIGGYDAVMPAVDKLYDKILEDPLLAPLFSYDRLGLLKHHQVALITAAFGGPNKYAGQRLRDVHEPMLEQGVGDVHFDAVLQHLRSAMQELGVSEELITEALAIVETTRDEVLGRG